ncbi:putative Tartrateresistant acid phosphatase type 5 [Trypanosoma theileri]|uniref:Putative Tartrateresistant acid phosphatase type 5 n=1 Tax=Trypanosoma theileri TaxID=67003 RepID=A0A1X0P180_9TRYP|nr:putative Tartrateresistant acid phosphatase type 5 [Trypanosoma theileri]ORC90463.1 putative Tartrateresistant acid phosphatase type 5 [Trypanosoma theileri]
MQTLVLLISTLLLTQVFSNGGSNVVHGLTFGVIGDWGLGGYASAWNSEIISTRRYAEVCGKLGCNFTISVGDNFYCGDLSYCIRHSFEEDMKNISGPFFPSRGNHDNLGGQLAYAKRNPRWYWPSPYYTVKLPIDDTGYTVQLFAVDTVDRSLQGGHQYNWLVKELQASDARWKIIFGHYPTAGSGRHRRMKMVSKLNWIMKEYNAQVYFSGHDHIVEVNNLEGRVLAISGGMSRGAMMAHGIGGSARRFTLTSPNEYSRYVQPWAIHGFLTVDLAPNTMSLQVWASGGGMHYEFVVTHDWMQRVMELPPEERNFWPPPEVVLQSMKDERKLPPGPGGGIVFNADGTRMGFEQQGNNTPNKDKNETTPGNTNTTNTTNTTENTSNTSRTDTNTPETPTVPAFKPLPPAAVPEYVRYALSTECENCDGKPRVGKRFTLHINGITLGPQHRLFLTSRVEGCEITGIGRHLLPGTSVETPRRNILQFNVSKQVNKAYVCLSIDAGATYGKIFREDTLDESNVFSVIPE